MTSQDHAPVRIGIIGLGLIGEIHLRAYRDCPGIAVVAIAEPDRARREAVDDRSIARHADHRAMLAHETLDIVCVCTPASSHADVVLDCADAGVHILCEKPLCLTLADADRMIAGCARNGVQLAYGASYRFLPALARARELIAAGEIGEVVLMREHLVGGAGPQSHRPLAPSHYPHGGPGGSGLGLVDHGVHLIDAFRWLADSPVVRAVGRGNVAGQAPRTEYLHMEFASGATGELLYNDATFGTELPSEGVFTLGEGWDLSGPVAPGHWLPRPGSIHVHGTRGALRILHYANLLYQTREDGRIVQHAIDEPPPPLHFRAQMLSFVGRLRTGQDAAVTAAAGRDALAVLLTAYHPFPDLDDR